MKDVNSDHYKYNNTDYRLETSMVLYQIQDGISV